MDVRVVLVRPRYAGNVGAAMRVAANFGVAHLALVAPVAWMDDPERAQMSMGAEKHVRLTEHDTLEDAVAEVETVVATTSARSRDTRAVVPLAEVKRRLSSSGGRRVAIVFGSERGGLSKAELRASTLLTRIPTHPRYPVLNLAQAVGIALFALTDELPPPPAEPPDPLDLPASHGELAAALAHLGDTLRRTGFLDPANPERVMDQVRRLVGRALPTRREVAIVRGLAAHVDYIVGRVSASG